MPPGAYRNGAQRPSPDSSAQQPSAPTSLMSKPRRPNPRPMPRSREACASLLQAWCACTHAMPQAPTWLRQAAVSSRPHAGLHPKAQVHMHRCQWAEPMSAWK